MAPGTWRSMLLALPLAAIACGPPPAEETTPPADPMADVPPKELFERGVALAQAGDFVRAEQYLAEARDRGHAEEQVMPVLIRVCLASSRLRAALGYAEPYLERHPDAWALRFLVASIHLGLGRPEDARAELERVVREKPRQAEPHFLLAVVLRDAFGESDSARPHFERYLELAPEGEHATEVREALRQEPVSRPVRIERSEVPEAGEAAPERAGAQEATGDDAAAAEEGAAEEGADETAADETGTEDGG